MKRKYIYVPGLSESVESELKKEKSEQVERIISATGAVKKKILVKDKGKLREKMDEDRSITIPVWKKYALTLKEGTEYYNIAETKLKEFIASNKKEIFVLKAGGRGLIKRKIFEEFLDQNSII